VISVQKGWVVIPKVYRQKYKLKAGTKVRIIDYGSGMSIVPLPPDPIRALRGLFAEGPSLIDDLFIEKGYGHRFVQIRHRVFYHPV